MDNSELLNTISSSGSGGDNDSAEPVRYRKLVVFLLEDAPYAFGAAEVKEVVITGDIYHIPFVPPYVAGMINRHGEPYTVLDLKAILDNGKLTSSKVLVMNNGDDQISFLISDIEKIIEVPEQDIHELPPSEAGSLFNGSFTRDGREIFIINARDIYEKLNADIKNI